MSLLWIEYEWPSEDRAATGLECAIRGPDRARIAKESTHCGEDLFAP